MRRVSSSGLLFICSLPNENDIKLEYWQDLNFNFLLYVNYLSLVILNQTLNKKWWSQRQSASCVTGAFIVCCTVQSSSTLKSWVSHIFRSPANTQPAAHWLGWSRCDSVYRYSPWPCYNSRGCVASRAHSAHHITTVRQWCDSSGELVSCLTGQHSKPELTVSVQLSEQHIRKSLTKDLLSLKAAGIYSATNAYRGPEERETVEKLHIFAVVVKLK